MEAVGGVRAVGRDERAERRRHLLAVQRSRFWCYVASCGVGILLKVAGALDVSWLGIVGIFVGAQATVAAWTLAAKYGLEERWGVDLAWLWMGTDVVFNSIGVYISGGLASPWYLMYLFNMFGAAFVRGGLGATISALCNATAYVGVLAFMGDIHFFDHGFFTAAGRMVLMGTAYFFMVRGILDLRKKRSVIRRMKEDESRKVHELTRLTAALDSRTHALAEANQRIREADRLKSRFLANMSHELRTPLNSIIGFSEILESKLATTLDPRHARFLRNIHSSGTHLLGVINDILDLSKVEAGRMEVRPEKLSFDRLIDGVLAIMKGAAGARGIRFEVTVEPGTPTFEADAVRAKQILYNLLSNAVKFSPDGSLVTIAARGLDAAASPLGVAAIEIAVIDRGIGIDPKNHELVFEEFRQVDAGSARKYEGTGLGLSLVRKFIELHRGQIRLESRLGEGARFIVTLPLKSAAESSEPQTARPPVLPQATRAAVLVVEDDPTAYEKIASDLERGDYRCLRARTGEEALELARTVAPAAITLDLVLPGMDGWEVLRRLKEDSTTRDMPVIIVSMVDSRELGVALGADGYFVKPPDGQSLVRRIRELVPRATARLLAIDDDQQVHDLLDEMLAPRGYALAHALSGAEGLALAEKQPPDLIILDLMMQGVDGFEVASRLKDRPETAHVPILILTAKDLSNAERHALSAHAGALLAKSEARESGRLVDTLQELLRRAPSRGGEVEHV